MAINVDISKITGINQVGNSYQRKSAVPLDYFSFFNTKAEAEAYAANNPVAYVGQFLAYTDGDVVKACVIADAAGTLTYLAQTTATGDVAGDVAALQTKVANLETAVSGINTALESVYTKTEVDNLLANAKDDRVDGLVTDVANLGANKADKATTLAGYGITDAYTKEEANTAINDAVKGILGEDVDKAYDTLKEIQDILAGTDGEAIDGLIEVADANKQALDILTGDANIAGSVDNKIAALNIGDYAKTADVANTYATKAAVGDVPNVPDAEGNNKYEGLTVIGYINKKAQETLDAASGNSSETAASVKQQLDDYKGENSPKFEKLEGIAAGAQVNVLEGVQINGVDLTIDENKKVNVTPAGLGVYTKGETDAEVKKATDAASANAGLIETLTSRVSTAEGKINDNAKAIADHATEYATLAGIVSGHTAAIGNKAEQSALDTLTETVGTNTGNITTLTGRVSANETAITNLGNDKANKSETYTKTDIDGIVGTRTEGKTLVQMIADAKTEATYDDTQIKKDIAANTAAIAILNGSEEGSVAKIASDAAKAEVATLVGEAPETLDTIHEIAAWITNDEDGAAALTKRVAANEKAVTETLPEAIAQSLTDAKKYTDDTIANYTVKSVVSGHNAITVNNVDGVVTVGFASEIILNGGNATA